MADRRGRNSNSRNPDKKPRTRRGSRVIDSRVLAAGKSHGLDPDDFTEIGYSCRICGFATRKAGYPGRQSLRAHMKRHVRDRRSFMRPLLKQIAVLVLSLVLGIGSYYTVLLPVGELWRDR